MDEKEFAKEMSDLLFVYRNSKNITLEQLSKNVGVEGRFLNLLERGKHATLFPTYFKIAKYLEIPIEEILKVINRYFKQ